jgi:hypothetical protein
MQKRILVFAILCSFFIARELLSQGSYPEIVRPYSIQDFSGQSLAATNVAFSGSAPNVVLNPALLSQVNRPLLFTSLQGTYLHSNIDIAQLYVDVDETSESVTFTDQSADLGSTAIACPFTIKGQKLIVAASYDGRSLSIFDRCGQINSDNAMGYVYSSDWNVSTASLGIAVPISATFGAGVGVTKWFGKNSSITQANSVLSSRTRKKAVYEDFGLHTGVMATLGKFTAGLVFHAPHKLYSSEYRMGDPIMLLSKFDNMFNGELQAGMSMRVQQNLLVGLDYGYQIGSTITHRIYDTVEEKETKGLSHFSAGLEKRLKLAQFDMPVYLAYQGAWIPYLPPNNPLAVDVSGDENFHYTSEVAGGAHLLFSSFGLFLDAKWTHSRYKVGSRLEDLTSPS